jgi:hypothetical protein
MTDQFLLDQYLRAYWFIFRAFGFAQMIKAD